MAVNVAELQGKPTEELVALIEKQDADIVKLNEGGDKPAEGTPAADKPAEGGTAVASGDKRAEGTPAEDKPAEGTVDSKQFTEIKEKNKVLTEKQEKDGKTIKELTERNRKNDIETRLSEYSKKGFPTPVIDKMKEVMLADTGEITIKLSETEGEGDAKKTVEKDRTLSDAVCAVVDSFPTITLGERTVIHSDGSGDTVPQQNKDGDLQKVNDYMKENKCSFKEAQAKLFSDKKIESRRY